MRMNCQEQCLAANCRGNVQGIVQRICFRENVLVDKSDSDDQKRSPVFFQEKYGLPPQVRGPTFFSEQGPA